MTTKDESLRVGFGGLFLLGKATVVYTSCSRPQLIVLHSELKDTPVKAAHTAVKTSGPDSCLQHLPPKKVVLIDRHNQL